MTSPIIPELFLKIIEAELSEATLNIVKWLCEEYKLSFEEVKEKLGSRICFKININSQKNYRVKKIVHRKIVEPNNQCIANIFCKDQRDVRQCTNKMHKQKFCMMHYNMRNSLKYGTTENV